MRAIEPPISCVYDAAGVTIDGARAVLRQLRFTAFFCLLALVAAWLAPPRAAQAGDAKPLHGVALVIGEAAYEHLPALENTGNDARAMARLLGDLGFDVSTVADGDRDRLAKSLKRFVEDAADADVALLYYSGHGIEAGGENYLVPTNADISSLRDAENTLVPLSRVLAGLKAAVPVSIVLLDACRSDPFPPGALAATASGSAPVAAQGLELTRGAAPLSGTAEAPQSLGTVIGFAAEPGRAALDGDAGGHSPYAAALLKHLAAGGFDFGDVMTMVAEEVYVKTEGRQLPWTNGSLRRLLYFGKAPEEPTGDEGAIRSARRKLLLTIASTPQDMRSIVESVAAQNDVPLDALYGMLDVLEVDTSGGPHDLKAQLSTGAQRLRQFMAERDVQTRQDPELARLSGLADQAESEGAMALALQFRARASTRAEAIDKALDEAEANIKDRRLELSRTFEDHARTAILNFDYRTAAQEYEAAFKQSERWDVPRAYALKVSEADAWADYGYQDGQPAALQSSLAVYQQALAIGRASTDQRRDTALVGNMAIVMTQLGELTGDIGWLRQAATTYDQVLKSTSRKRDPEDWAIGQLNIGSLRQQLGDRTGDRSQYRSRPEGVPGRARHHEPPAGAGRMGRPADEHR